jgi:nitrite reductase/ring-hydroxylating ferredoxin subunit
MPRADRRLLRFIDALLNDRHPRRGPAGDDLGAMQLAAQLRAAHPGSSEPSPEFVDGLARRLRREQETANSFQPRRRQFLITGLATAAAGIGAGFGLERLHETLTETPSGSSLSNLIEPNWVAVAKLADITPGKIQRFSAGGVEGFVFKVSDELRALSAACTDQGCILHADATTARLACPCHWATFKLDGEPDRNDYGYPLTPLPAIQVRASGDDVEVLVPKTA